jgi:hypothetical protein
LWNKLRSSQGKNGAPGDLRLPSLITKNGTTGSETEVARSRRGFYLKKVAKGDETAWNE